MRAEGEMYRESRVRSEKVYNKKRQAMRHANPVKYRLVYMEQNRLYRKRLKEQTIAAYGGKCACCNEQQIAFLGIDHPNGHGAEHRNLLAEGNRGVGFYIALKRAGWPNDPPLRVLCTTAIWPPDTAEPAHIKRGDTWNTCWRR